MHDTIAGLDPGLFADRDARSAAGAIRCGAEAGGAPCRVSLEDAAEDGAMRPAPFLHAAARSCFLARAEARR